MKKYCLTFFSLFFILAFSQPARAQTLAQKLAGRILLQVESHGEAWYINPENLERYYLGRPDDAFAIMRNLGLGISNKNLAKIPFDLNSYQGQDSDQDGLSDELEKSFGTDPDSVDSDQDGYSDSQELSQAFDPLGSGDLPIDPAFTSRQKGKILLQVESLGQAWYVNPTNGKRYYLGRPQDAFNVMKSLGLGIANQNLEQIKIHPFGLPLLSANIDISQPPLQMQVSGLDSIVILNSNATTTLNPLYSYRISGKVEAAVEVNDGIHDIMPVDVVISWGLLATYNDVLTTTHQGRIANNTFIYQEGQKLCETDEVEECVSNNHLIPANENLRQVILEKIKKGDYIKIEGYLTNGEKIVKNGNIIITTKFTTSAARSDTGTNSCEIIYVTSIQINNETYQ